MGIDNYVHTHTHTHAHTYIQEHAHKHYTDCWVNGQYYSVEMLKEEKCLELISEGRKSSRVSGILGEVVPDVRTETGERAKASNLAVEVSGFEYACV